MLAWFLAFDIVGVLLTLLVDLAVVLHRRWEGSSPLAYVIWFVVGVFCAVFIYFRRTSEEGPDTPAGRRTGRRLVMVVGAVSLVLGFLSSLVWSGSGASEAVAPDHRGMTITYLVTVFLAVVWMRFALFREQSAAPNEPADPPPAKVRSIGSGLGRVRARIKAPDPAGAPFKPAGLGKSVGLALGVPVLLFLDVSVFVLGPLDYFDRWTDPLLSAALVGGFAWGIASGRWRSPRRGLLLLHVPLLLGAVFYFFAVLLGGLLVAFGAPESGAEVLSYLGFSLGFGLGVVAIVVGLKEPSEHSTP